MAEPTSADLTREAHFLNKMRLQNEHGRQRDFAKGALVGMMWAIGAMQNSPSEFAAAFETKPETEAAAADPVIRHMAYTLLLGNLPKAAVAQRERFERSFAIPAERLAVDFADLRVTPDLAEPTKPAARSVAEIARLISDSFGDYLSGIAGFYNDGLGWQLHAPFRSFLIPHLESELVTAIVVAPFDNQTRFYFPLSSRRFERGAAAIKLPQNLFSFD